MAKSHFAFAQKILSLATDGGAAAGHRIPAGGAEGRTVRAGLDCEHAGSSWRGRFPSQGDFSRVGGIAKLAANGKCVSGWAGSEFNSKKTSFDKNCTNFRSHEGTKIGKTAPYRSILHPQSSILVSIRVPARRASLQAPESA